MILKSQYTRAILWWVAAGCFLALFLFAGFHRNDWNGTCAGIGVVFLICGCWSYRYAKTGGKDIQITDSILIDAPIENVFEIVETRCVEVWGTVDSHRAKVWGSPWSSAKADRHESSDYDLYYPVEVERDNPVGLTFVQVVKKVKTHPFIYTVTAHDKPNHLGLQVDASSFSGNAEYKFVTVEDGIRLEYSCEASFSSFYDCFSAWAWSRTVTREFRKQSRKTFQMVQGTD